MRRTGAAHRAMSTGEIKVLTGLGNQVADVQLVGQLGLLLPNTTVVLPLSVSGLAAAAESYRFQTQHSTGCQYETLPTCRPELNHDDVPTTDPQ